MRAKARAESGIGLIATLGLIVIALTLAEVALNAARYYSTRSAVKALAHQVAAYAGAYLPDPRYTCLNARQYFNARTINFMSGYERFAGAQLDIIFTSSRYDDIVVSDCSAPVEGVGLGGPEDGVTMDVQLPLKGVKIRIRQPVQFGILGLGNWFGVTAPLSVSASAIAENTVTDVVLIIENTNSVISPLDSSYHAVDPASLIPPSFTSSRGVPWDQEFIGHCDNGIASPTCDPEHDSRERLSKAEVYSRQCFGFVSETLKKAALKIYDTLSSSANVRVAVMHTMHLAGDLPMPQIRFNTHPLVRRAATYPDNTVNSLYSRSATSEFGLPVTVDNYGGDPDQDPPNGEYSYEHIYWAGTGSYEETRCMAMTELPQYAVPPHVFQGTVNFPWPLYTNLPAEVAEDTSRNDRRDYYPHLRYDEGTLLLPRELIWVTNAGHTGANGYPYPVHDFYPKQFAVTRALDLLLNAPMRADGLPVKRQRVIYLADGMEDGIGGGSQGAHFVQGQDYRQFMRLHDYEFDDPQADFEIYPAEPIPMPYYSTATTIALSGTACDDDGSYIDEVTRVPTSGGYRYQDGAKVNFLVLNSREGSSYYASNPNDPLLYYSILPGHRGGHAERDTYRARCNTHQSALRGLMMIEAGSNPSGIHLLNPRSYWQRLAPQIARSVLSVEVSM